MAERMGKRGMSPFLWDSEGEKGADEMRTMYIAIPKEEARSDPVRQRYVDESNLKKVFDRITASSDTLEKLVIHQVSHIPFKETYADDQCSHEMWDQHLPTRLNPFQSTSTSFPKLEHLQLGPNLCEHCTSSLLHLFVGLKYTRQPRYSIYTGRQEDEPEGDDDPNYTHQREAIWSSHGSIPRINTFNPSTTADVASRIVTYEESAAPNLVSLQLFISDRNWTEGNDGEIFDKLLKVVPRPNSIRMLQIWLRENFRWGGMGSSGTVTSYPCKEVKTVEEELTEWAKKEKEKNMTAQERLLAKIQADAAKVIPAAAKRRKLALAAVETEKNKNKDKAEGDLDGEDEEEKSDSPEGTAIKQEMLDVEAELKYEYGSDDESGSPSPSMSGPPKESNITNSERHAIYSHRWTARQCTHILGNVAQAMPDLVGLSVMRKGTLLPEITEGAREIGLEAAIWVEPLSKMDSLQYLNLGLAVSGKKEVVDFPIGLSITRSRKGRETAKATGNDLQALKRRKYELDIKKAIEEGDKWRIKVLKTFLIPRLSSASNSGDPVSLADAESSVGVGEADEEGSLITWPKSLKSGYIYSADLADRLRGNGLAIPWKVVGRTVALGEPKKIKF